MNSTIDSNLRRKTIWYIIIGILIVILLAAYIYETISAKQVYVPAAVSVQTEQPPGLTPQQAAASVAVIDQITTEHPNTMTPSQAAARSASLNRLSAEQ